MRTSKNKLKKGKADLKDRMFVKLDDCIDNTNNTNNTNKAITIIIIFY